MYIEFKLPSGAGGMAAGYTRQAIKRQVSDIVRKHNITVIDTIDMGYTHCIELSEHDLTMLALCWDEKNSWHKFTVRTDKSISELRELLRNK